MEFARVHPLVIAAMLEELQGLHIFANFQGMTTKAIPFNKCARQGGVESTFQWNVAMAYIFAQVKRKWDERGMGLEINGKRYTHLIWAERLAAGCKCGNAPGDDQGPE